MNHLLVRTFVKLCAFIVIIEASFLSFPHHHQHNKIKRCHKSLLTSSAANKHKSFFYKTNKKVLNPLGNTSIHQKRQNLKMFELHALSNIVTGSTITNPHLSTFLDVSFTTSSVVLLVVYHLVLFEKEKSKQTWRLYQASIREEWAIYVRDTEGWLYAIQSLRNAMTAQTFLASTVLSLLTLITGRLWEMLRTTTNKVERRLLIMQTFSIAFTMLSSAYQFLQGVRLMTHVGFMFPVIKKDDLKVNKLMRKTEMCQWLGLRWCYISVAPIFWAVGGSRAFFLSSILLTIFFRIIDKLPDDRGSKISY